MMKKIRPSFRLMGAAALAAALPLAALAQQTLSTPPPPPPDEEAPRIVLPKRSLPEPPGIRGNKTAGSINWAAVREVVENTRERDAIFLRQSGLLDSTRVISPSEQRQINAQRPKGMRALAENETQEAQRAEIKRTRVPVLIPNIPDAIGEVQIYANENSFTASADLPDGASVEITGTRMRVITRNPDMVKLRSAERKRASKRLEGIEAQYVISRHEQGVDLSFSKFNAAYMITIFCPAPDDNPRCANDDYVISLAEDLTLLNEKEGDAP